MNLRVWTRVLALVCLMVAFGAASAALAAGIHYEETDLIRPAGTDGVTRESDIAEDGTVFGEFYTCIAAGGGCGVLPQLATWDPSGNLSLVTQPAGYSRFSMGGISPNGDFLAASADNVGGATAAIVWVSGTPTVIATGTLTGAEAVNDSGWVAGSRLGLPTVWIPDTDPVAPTLSGPNDNGWIAVTVDTSQGLLSAINNAGTAAGTTGIYSPLSSAPAQGDQLIRWTLAGGSTFHAPLAGYTRVFASDINESGVVSGNLIVSGSVFSEGRPVLHDGTGWSLIPGFVDADKARAESINNLGQVLGTSNFIGNRAWIWDGATLIDINDFDRYFLTEGAGLASGINDAGQVVTQLGSALALRRFDPMPDGPPVFDPVSDSVLQANTVGGWTPPTVFNVAYLSPSAQDFSALIPGTCSPDNDGFFPVGSTPVTCTATDINGNTGSVSFAVVVEDNVDPVFDLSTVPTSVTLEAEGPDGASFRYPTPIASDQIDPVVDVACDPESGSLFPLGTTNVLCEAVDDSGNTAVVSFSVTVVDSSAPQFGAAPDIAADAEDATGADVVYALPVANDLVDGNVAVACSPGSGARFPLGPTTVACTASDNAGNTASVSFVVTISDNTPPLIMTPEEEVVVVEATSPAGAVVDFVVSAVDAVDGPVPFVCSPPSGSLFPIGFTTVTCTASDAAGNERTTSFPVIVEDLPGIPGIPGVIDEIESALPTGSNDIDKELNGALKDLNKALDHLAEDPIARKDAINDIRKAVKDIEDAVDDGFDASIGGALIDALVQEAIALAQDAIDDAIAAGGDADDIADAQDELAAGLAEIADGMILDGLKDLQKAADKAEDAV